MTNEEAIKYLIAPVATSTEPSAEYLKQKEAYDLAIKTLQTGEVYMTGEDYNMYLEGYKDAKKDFEPKQGEWIRTGSLGNGNAQYECSNCHYGDEQAESQEVPYCWHCGAKMRKGGAK